MGNLAQPLNTFWQIFMQRPGSAQWTLVTPPGTADNGGLVVDTTATTIEAGFLPSADLKFSPIVAAPAASIHWRSLGLLQEAFSSLPDSFASTSGERYALLASGGGQVVGAPPSQSTWRYVTSGRQLGSVGAGLRCGVERLSAITTAAPSLYVGADCSHAVSGVFSLRNGHWSLAPIHLPASFGSGSSSVLRLTVTRARSTRLAGLLSGGPAGDLLAATWSSGAAGGWVVSEPLDVGRGARLVTSGFGPQAQQVVAWRTSGGALRAAVIDGPHQPWLTLPAPPRGTAALVVESAGLEALAADSALLTVWRLDPRARRWTAVQRMQVPIELGSSG
jgi:hypothetical protein